MVHLTHGIRSLFRKRVVMKLMAIIIIVILMVSSLYIAGSLFFKPSENGDTLKINLNQTRDYTRKGVTYEFKYVSTSTGNQLQVSTNGKTPISYAAVTGATYNPFDLKITINSANANQLDIHIAPP
jgi:hypothetical protein